MPTSKDADTELQKEIQKALEQEEKSRLVSKEEDLDRDNIHTPKRHHRGDQHDYRKPRGR